MKSNFFKVAMMVFLVLGPAKAMMEDEAHSKHTQLKFLQKKLSKTKSSLSSEVPIESLADELLLAIFRFVEIPDLDILSQVSTRWNRITETPSLWKFMGAKYYGDFLSPNDLTTNPKQKVVSHSLRVVVNHTENLREIDRLVHHHQLHLYDPLFTKYISKMNLLLFRYVECLSSRKELIMQGYEHFIESKGIGLVNEGNGYEQALEAEREFNDFLAQRGDQKAIQRKIEGLSKGKYGYEKDLVAARALNEFFVKQGNLEAIERKIEGLVEGKYGYEIRPEVIKTLNEPLVKRRNEKAIERKIKGFLYGHFGYEKDLVAARELNELLVKEGNSAANNRKTFGLDSHNRTDERIELNEFYVEQGYPEAIQRKIWGLENGSYGYKRNPSAIASFLSPFVEKGYPLAIERKIEGLLRGEYGYEKDPETARELNEFYVEKGNLEAIERKIKGLLLGYCGYEKKQIAIKEVNELLVKKGISGALQRKLVGLLRGQYGYEKDPVAARELLHQFLMEKGSIKTIERQVLALEKGWDGDEKDPESAKELEELLLQLNEPLVEKGNPEAFRRKIEGLIKGEYGYEKNLTAARELLSQLNMTEIEKQLVEAQENWYYKSMSQLEIARELNEALVERENQKSIERKLAALSAGRQTLYPVANPFMATVAYVPTCGYEKDPVAAREFNDLLIERGNLEAKKRKFKALYGSKTRFASYGYQCDLTAAREFNDLLIERGDPEAILGKVKGLIRGKNTYKKDPVAARMFIEDLSISEFPIVRGIGKYIKAFAIKYGISDLGYEKDREKAFKFIRENWVPY